MTTIQKKYRAFLFDVGGVLIHFDPPFTELYQTALQSKGLTFPIEEIKAALKKMYSALTHKSEQNPEFQFGLEDWAPAFLTHLDLSTEQRSEATKAIADHFKRDIRMRPNEQAYSLLEFLVRCNISLGVVSNWDLSLAETLRSFHLLDYFQTVIASEEVGFSKPHPHIFRTTIEEMGIPREETAYIGDHYFMDVIGARRASIDPILYDPHNHYADADCTRIAALADLVGFIETTDEDK